MVPLKSQQAENRSFFILTWQITFKIAKVRSNVIDNVFVDVLFSKSNTTVQPINTPVPNWVHANNGQVALTLHAQCIN